MQGEQWRKLPLPPGPKPLPLIGNIYQIPSENPWRKYQEWNATYGPIISFKLGLQTVICLGTHQVAHEILAKKSEVYSSRPPLVFMGECVFRGLNTALLPYTKQWRLHSRIQTKFLKPVWAERYAPLYDLESKQLLLDFLHGDHDIRDVFLRFSYSLTATLTYSKRIETVDGKMLRVIVEASESIAQMSATPMVSLVQLFPILNRLPRPLAPWKALGDEIYEKATALYRDCWTEGQKSQSWNWLRGAFDRSVTADIDTEEFIHIIGFIFDAGAEPMTGVMEIFVLAMLTFPDVMKKAQQEIDQRMNATNRSNQMPAGEDLVHLPYTMAILEETLRWRSIAPGGFAHKTTADDEFGGYRIPKGSMVIFNHWGMDLDPEVFHNPMEFRPERWLENPDLPLAVFGFARRACPGRHVGKGAIKLAICRMLWLFDILPPNVNGEEIKPDPLDMVQGLLSPPTPFKAVFKLRGVERADILEQEWRTTEKDPDTLMNSIYEKGA
ncbi:hypothetical protein P175DRAFT_0506365 [Aspergillus ochraceoroseus IBT 24754]|uniref:Cytochrome P450 n=1 Tax=Aspergillus ochraceoroseus IBT 24754 TaxID=1392256 RepID=A0A2T5M8A7_9EURO|nr:uncharacterized protein P175DRAFT_0506365 [Aspergillus ochraceoroseus IBT 24754]PTU24768.1 hypothetical protein P175DRAFT_0506365 [Aspergillus ochraceoroseus IBT 24754]